jgi:hypothetical protein
LAAYDAMDEEKRRALLMMAKAFAQAPTPDPLPAEPPVLPAAPKRRASGCVVNVAKRRT